MSDDVVVSLWDLSDPVLIGDSAVVGHVKVGDGVHVDLVVDRVVPDMPEHARFRHTAEYPVVLRPARFDLLRNQVESVALAPLLTGCRWRVASRAVPGGRDPDGHGPLAFLCSSDVVEELRLAVAAEAGVCQILRSVRRKAQYGLTRAECDAPEEAKAPTSTIALLELEGSAFDQRSTIEEAEVQPGLRQQDVASVPCGDFEEGVMDRDFRALRREDRSGMGVTATTSAAGAKRQQTGQKNQDSEVHGFSFLARECFGMFCENQQRSTRS